MGFIQAAGQISKTIVWLLLCFSCYSTQWGVLIVFPIFCVGDEGPLRATYFRQDLSHVVGSPNLRVLCLIRLPSDHRQLSPLRASLLSLWYEIIVERQRSPVSECLRVSSISVLFFNFSQGPRWISQVLNCISLYMPQPFDSGDPPHPYHYGCFCIDFGGR